MKDIIVLVADKNMEFTVKGVLQRTASLKIRERRTRYKSTHQQRPWCI